MKGAVLLAVACSSGEANLGGSDYAFPQPAADACAAGGCTPPPSCDAGTAGCGNVTADASVPPAACPGSPCDAATPNCDADGTCFGPCASNADCTNPTEPNCDPDTGLCQGPCPDETCPSALPNCDANGTCFGPCTSNGDCTNPTEPNCNTTTGRCFGACTTRADCPQAALPNCSAGGLCVGPCIDDSGCTLPAEPNCDPATGLCQGTCPAVACPATLPNCSSTGACLGPCQTSADCPSNLPNCDPVTGLCAGACSDNADCPDPALPNCGDSGICVGPCASHADCTAAGRPNCQLDGALPNAGLCLAPCATSADCPSATYPNCDPATGRCVASCSTDADCPVSGDLCNTSTGLCFTPECLVDAECNPPSTICEAYACVPGCTSHGDCLPAERCELRGPADLNHCVTRDCLVDSDCNPPTTVCDTDGLVDPSGGGYCDPGCQTAYDCGQAGYDCDVPSGTCQPHDYGDIGAACGGAGSCSSGMCLSTYGNVCTDFCCTQNDCPAGWGCRAESDGTGSSHTVDVCVPLTGQGAGRYGDACSSDGDCRSDICRSGKCTETCCGDQDCDQPFASGMYCGAGGSVHPSYCRPLPLLGNAPMGTLGCTTTGSPTDCKSNMCFTFYISDTGCTSDAQCAASRPTCWDWPNGSGNGVGDCVRDMCLDNCCSADDCVGPSGGTYYCGKSVIAGGDYNVCLYHFGTATLAEGDSCTSNGQCRSNFCSAVSGTCRRRCCDDSDCTTPGLSNCTLEPFDLLGSQRLLNVCTP